jgi:streptogramin lyase
VRICPKSLLPIVLILPLAGLVAQATAQGITEFPLPSGGRPYGITGGPDGNVWFTIPDSQHYGGSIGRVTPGGVFTEFSRLNPAPSFIVTGPDGNLWFTADDGCDDGIASIGRMTPAGVLTLFWAGPCRLIDDIAVGSDGNLWFTWTQSMGFVYAYGISKITTAGGRADFPLSGAHGIAAGPDGAIWFTEGNPLGSSWGPNGVDRIGRITTEGAISEFALPAGSAPAGIVTGPDGNLWFTETSGNKIGRITPLGTVTEFPVPTAGSRPLYITSGPDGNLWFTEETGNKIGRVITVSGAITEFPIPTPGSRPVDITAGPDGNIWFTENGSNQIGRLSVVRGQTLETRILPVVVSTPGVGGSFFRTAVQLHNPTGSLMTGQVVFHRSGLSGSSSDPLLAYTLAPGQTQSIGDLLPELGLSGLGSADIEVTAGTVPVVTARVFNDAGAAGTTGFTEEPMRTEEALRPGPSGVLLLPADLTRFRFNLGVRTLEAGAAATLTLRDASGAMVTTLSRAYPATYHEQQNAAAFLGVGTLPPGGSISIAVSAGAAIFYGATADNTTGDPSLQIARAAPQ